MFECLHMHLLFTTTQSFVLTNNCKTKATNCSAELSQKVDRSNLKYAVSQYDWISNILLLHTEPASDGTDCKGV